jgi:tetratricopeptide (TPR) repeat protein
MELNSLAKNENPATGNGDRPTLSAEEYYEMAQKLFESDKHEEAIQAYAKSIALRPEFPDAYVNKALSLTILNRYEEAVKDLEKALELDPKAPDIPYIRGMVCEYQRDYKRAEDWYRKALELDSNYTNAKSRLDRLMTQPRPEETVTEIAKSVESEKLAEIEFLIGTEELILQRSWLSIDDLEEAARLFDEFKTENRYVSNLVTSQIAPWIARGFLKFTRIADSRVYLNRIFEASQEWNATVFKTDDFLRNLLYHTIDSSRVPRSANDVEEAFVAWRAKVDHRVESLKWDVKFIEWLSSGGNAADGLGVTSDAVKSLESLKSNDGFVESYLLSFQAYRLEIELAEGQPRDKILEELTKLWEKVETLRESLPRYTLSEILSDLLVLSNPREEKSHLLLKENTNVLSQWDQTRILGAWSLTDKSMLPGFEESLKRLPLTRTSQSELPYMFFRGIRPARVFQAAIAEGGLAKELIRGMVSRRPVRNVLQECVEKGVVRDELTPLVRGLIESSEDDERSLFVLAISDSSKGTLGLLLEAAAKRKNLDPIIINGIEFGGRWAILYKDLRKALAESKGSYTEQVENVLFALAVFG